MLHRLAVIEGRVSDFDAFCREMPAEVFKRWEAFFALEPWGFEHERECAGVVAASIYNANPYRDKKARVIKPRDFVPQLSKPKTRKRGRSVLAKERDELTVLAATGKARMFNADGTPIDPLTLLGG
jgi:hypothetical protein